MAAKPRVLVSLSKDRRIGSDVFFLNARYVGALREAGAQPLLIPDGFGDDELEALLELADGVLLSGGGDLAPRTYGQDPSAAQRSVSSSRDATELSLARLAYDRGVPLFGICRGAQAINVAFGGTLIQDIASARPGSLWHEQEGERGDEPFHGIVIEGDSRILSRAFGAGEAVVNSMHHQAVDSLAPTLRCAARSADGILEAFESEDPKRWVLGVQFHPEALLDRGPQFPALFRLFAEASAATADRRNRG